MSRRGLLSLCVLLGIAVPMRAAPAPERKIPREMLVERRDAAQETFNDFFKRWQYGQGNQPSTSDVILWSERWVEAELPLCKNGTERAAVLKAYVERARKFEELLLRAFRIGVVVKAEASAATYARSHAEIRYFEATGTRLPRKPARPDDSLVPGIRVAPKEPPGETLKPPPKEEEDTLPKPPKEKKK